MTFLLDQKQRSKLFPLHHNHIDDEISLWIADSLCHAGPIANVSPEMQFILNYAWKYPFEQLLYEFESNFEPSFNHKPSAKTKTCYWQYTISIHTLTLKYFYFSGTKTDLFQSVGDGGEHML